MSRTITNDEVMHVLQTVQDPELGKDLVSLGMIRNLAVENGRVEFTLHLASPDYVHKDRIRREAQQVVAGIEGVSEVVVNFAADMSSDSHAQETVHNSIRNSIAIASGKGGVGKTTVAVNVAVAIARTGVHVGLLDADIYGPNVPTMMGVHQIPATNEKKIIPAESYGVKLMSIGFLVAPNQPLIWRGPMLHSAIRQFITDVDWGELDYLIVDLPPGTGDAQLSLAQTIPLSGGIIVTLPQKVSLEDARRGLEMFRSMEIPILGIVENMSYLELPDGSTLDVFGQGGGENLAQETGVSLIGVIPMDPTVREAGDTGVPVVISHPDSTVANALTSLAEEVVAKLKVREGGGSDELKIDIID